MDFLNSFFVGIGIFQLVSREWYRAVLGSCFLLVEVLSDYVSVQCA